MKRRRRAAPALLAAALVGHAGGAAADSPSSPARAVAMPEVAAASSAASSPSPPSPTPVDLRLRPIPPRHLGMRPRRIAATTAPAAAPASSANRTARPSSAGRTAGPTPRAAAPSLPDASEALPTSATLRTGREELAFRFDVGFALDGAALSPEATTLAGNVVDNSGADGAPRLSQVRTYGFGDVFLGSRGLVLPNVTAFLSAHYRLSSALGRDLAPIAESQRGANELQVRSGWAEIKDPSRRRWLSPLRLRAGRFYVYGPWITHVDGLTVAWDGPAVQAAATFGGRVTALTSGERGGLPEPMTQLTVRGDLTALRRKVPAVASAELLRIDGHTHLHTQIAWQPRATLAIGAAARTLDDRLVNERFSVRGRFREINSIFAEIVHRHREDWQWDPSVLSLSASNGEDNDAGTGEPRRYLDLGASLPRMVVQVRAGTVLFDNIDLLGRVASGIDLRDDKTETPSSFSAAYVELGGALEVRLRRTLAVGASLTTRTTRREEVTPVLDTAGPMTLPIAGSYGETSFVEGGGIARLTLGARTLTFLGELYARRTTYAELYQSEDPTDPAQVLDRQTTHLGGRTSVEAWINRRLRVLARYEVVSQVKRAPEITGFKSLRVLVEATF